MHRSSGTRYTIYTGDGNGRDSYIIVGNGGNLKPGSFKNSAPHVGHHPQKASNSMLTGSAQPFVGSGKKATVYRNWGMEAFVTVML